MWYRARTRVLQYLKQWSSMSFAIDHRLYYISRRTLGNAPSLSEHLRARIEVKGPLTVAEYMRAVLTNPATGYYMHRDVFGQHGDFITSPEISQLFGEMVGIWFANELNKFHDATKAVQLIELGPGRGSLMMDVVQVFKKFRPKGQLSIHLVEVSPELSRLQAKRLCVEGSIECSSELNQANSSKHRHSEKAEHIRRYIVDKDISEVGGRKISTVTVRRPAGLKKEKGVQHYQKGAMADGTPVYWYYSLLDVPHQFSCFLANEFFDALPIHKFKKTKEGWKEILITTDPEKGLECFKFIISREETPSSKLFMKKSFQSLDEREEVELCPEGGVVAQQMASRLEEHGGIALVVDYGHEGERTDTFRAFRQHKLVDPLIAPGTADLTADVDFSYLSHYVMDKAITFGPVSQSHFLHSVGISVRLKVFLKRFEMLMESCTEQQRPILQSGYEMITKSMGDRYKFFSFFPRALEEHLKEYPVTGFTNK